MVLYLCTVTMAQPTSKISLSFSKKIERKSLKVSAIGNDNSQLSQAKGTKQTISSFDSDTKFLQPNQPYEIVIPMVESKRTALIEKLKQKVKKQQDSAEAKLKDDKVEDKELTLEDQAAAAVLKECSEKLAQIKNKYDNDSLAIQVKPMEDLLSAEQDDTGEVSTLDEYEEVNVDCFGAALLRGMGWKKDKGIGKQNRVVEIVTPSSRTFGQTTADGGTKKVTQDDEEQIELKKGAYVHIDNGRNRGTYGTVESIDEDHVLIRPVKGDRILREVEQNIRAVSTKEFKDLSRVINKEMYDEYKDAEKKKKKRGKDDDDDFNSKESTKRKKEDERMREMKDQEGRYEKERNQNENHIHRNESKTTREVEPLRDKEYNRDKYERNSKAGKEDPPQSLKREKDGKDTRENEKDKKEVLKDSEKDRKDVYKERETYIKDVYKEREKDRKDGLKDRKKDRKDVYKEKEKDRNDFSKKKDKSERRNYEHSKLKTHKEKYSEKYSQPIPNIPWARENLRVRIIDKDYQRGRYHKQKVIVRCVETVNNCTCLSDDGSVLYDVDPHHLETVIPKTPGAVVLVVKGQYKGQRGRILELQKDKEKATLQFLTDNSILAKLHYDDICEVITR